MDLSFEKRTAAAAGRGRSPRRCRVSRRRLAARRRRYRPAVHHHGVDTIGSRRRRKHRWLRAQTRNHCVASRLSITPCKRHNQPNYGGTPTLPVGCGVMDVVVFGS